ncbi:MAG: cytochrome c-type biogenesis protein CcmH [Proteobacteria bacterium]|nr:cytochrome c-type biogenesis protein CcmH [Pseudomonadota bacterium]
MKVIHMFCMLFFFSVILITSVSAEVSENRVREIAHKLRCPTCQALSVKESEAGIADNMKIKIRQLLEEGKNEEEILQFFIDRYGEWILRSPKKEGFNLVLWIAPGGFIVLASLIILLRSRSKGVEEEESQDMVSVPLTAKEEKEIEKEIQKLERS